MYKSKTHGLIQDISKTELLKMREGGMSNAAIAASLGCHKQTILRLIGPQPKEITSRTISEGRRAALSAPSEGGVYRGA